ncbi:hypothetical protein TNCV_2712931 [Trichonephila clavipes]|nr:hypothetical protein TNCV_2712931 [Trichonephila clavipes]
MIPTFRIQHPICSTHTIQTSVKWISIMTPSTKMQRTGKALSVTGTASFSSVDEMPSANASGCRPILWFHADSTFQPKQKGRG